jgi:RNA polymerase sigma-70 factor (ECF subfamily)
MPETSDEELLKRCRIGEVQAFDALVERYQRRVIGLCYRHVHQYEEACDLAQEVFAQAFHHLKDFQGKSSFSTWLYRVALNASYNRQRYHRAKGRDTVTSLEGMLERREGEPDAAAYMKGPDRGALEQLENAEEIALLRQALAAMEEDQRKIVELVDIEELTYDEAARILDLPVNTVRSRLSRARRLLKEKFLRLRKRLES